MQQDRLWQVCMLRVGSACDASALADTGGASLAQYASLALVLFDADAQVC